MGAIAPVDFWERPWERPNCTRRFLGKTIDCTHQLKILKLPLCIYQNNPFILILHLQQGLRQGSKSMGANFHDSTKLTNKTNSQNLLLTLRFRKLMGAIDAFSKIDGCNCTHCTPLAEALYSNYSKSNSFEGFFQCYLITKSYFLKKTLFISFQIPH